MQAVLALDGAVHGWKISWQRSVRTVMIETAHLHLPDLTLPSNRKLQVRADLYDQGVRMP
jgi:hypothetical protein